MRRQCADNECADNVLSAHCRHIVGRHSSPRGKRPRGSGTLHSLPVTNGKLRSVRSGHFARLKLRRIFRLLRLGRRGPTPRGIFWGGCYGGSHSPGDVPRIHCAGKPVPMMHESPHQLTACLGERACVATPCRLPPKRPMVQRFRRGIRPWSTKADEESDLAN